MSAKRKSVEFLILSAIPLFIALLNVFGPFLTDTVYLYSEIAIDVRSSILHGYPTIDPNVGTTSFALGSRAALDVLSGHLPLWNHYEGLGAPLLGEMQSAALFPPTWLLALPHGQAIEQAFLQLIAGVGAFLFFRKFGLATTAALAGGLLFEVNGVFAWLRNAIYNPVAFLPWLFFSVESLRAAVAAEWKLRQRLPMIGVGAVMGALALYAGFPEEVYLYALLLLGWVALRMTELSRRQNLTFVGDLLLTGLIAFALSAPILIAFADFLGEAALASHSGNGFYGRWIPSDAIVQYLLPYIFGPIFASGNQVLSIIWGNTGGFIGFVPVVLALAALFVPHRRAVKIFLVGWVILALGVTHGLPGVYHAFMALPLVKLAACYRYLNPSWIFCIVFLSALFIDAVPALSQRDLRRTLGLALACGLVLIVLAGISAGPLIYELWKASGENRSFMIVSLLSVAVLSLWIMGIVRFDRSDGRAAAALSGVLVSEAVVLFLLPFLSYPRHGKVDKDAIEFLRANIGYQRVVNTSEASLSANYGSYFEIPLLNYDDIPAPEMTGNYVRKNLDPYANRNLFIPGWNLTPKQQVEHKKIFRERLSRYAQVGVKYVLAAADFNLNPAFAISSLGHYPYVLAAGQKVDISARGGPTTSAVVASVWLLVGTYHNTSSGHLQVTFCGAAGCAAGVADLGVAEDHKLMRVALDHPVAVDAEAAYSIRIEKLDGEGDVALWMFPSASNDTTAKIVGTPTAVRDKYLPDLRLTSSSDAKLVHQSPSMSIYQLTDTRDYFSADSCSLKALTHDRVDTTCAHASKLTRLELFMHGWSATVDGRPAPVGLSDGVFQTVDLPEGAARVEFTYEPLGFKPAMAAAGAALLLVLLVFGGAIRGLLARN